MSVASRLKPKGSSPTLKTDLSSFEVRRGDAVHFVLASYWSDCPLPHGGAGGDCLAPESQPLTTHIVSAPSVQAWEPGVHYRLPPVACEALSVDVPMSLIPLRVTIEHVPSTSVHSTGLWFGSYTLCGLFPSETAKKWAAFFTQPSHSLADWRLLCRSRGLDASWLDQLRPGAVRISCADPLLTRAVEVHRETA